MSTHRLVNIDAYVIINNSCVLVVLVTKDLYNSYPICILIEKKESGNYIVMAKADAEGGSVGISSGMVDTWSSSW